MKKLNDIEYIPANIVNPQPIYVISYIWNDKTYAVEFTDRKAAYNYYWELRDSGKVPSMHFKN